MIEEAIGDSGDFFDGAAGVEGFDGIESERPEEGAAFDGGVEFASDHGFEGAFHAIDGEDEDIGAGFFSGFFDGLDGPDGHVIIVGVDDREGGVNFEEGFGDLFATGAGEFAALGGDDFHLGRGFDAGFEAAFAVDGGGGAWGALEFDDLGLAVGFFGEPIGGHLAFGDEIGSDEGGVEGLVFHLDSAIDEDDGDLGFFGFAEDGIPAGFDYGSEDDGVDALGDESADGFDLIFLFSLGIGELQSDAAFGGFVLDGLGFGASPGAFCADLSEADGQGFRGFFLAAEKQGGEGEGGGEAEEAKEEASGELHKEVELKMGTMNGSGVMDNNFSWELGGELREGFGGIDDFGGGGASSFSGEGGGEEIEGGAGDAASGD